MEGARPYDTRVVDAQLDTLMEQLPAIAIEGAKAVGKTATASRRVASILELDNPATRAIAEADLDRIVDSGSRVLIDEWQHVPQVWDRIRRAVDRGAPPGRFLLTGSASPAHSGTHSGGGRIVGLRMRPMALGERLEVPTTVSLALLLEGERPGPSGSSPMRLEGYVEEILRSGFPGLRSLTGLSHRHQLDSYLDRIVDRDFPELGLVPRKPTALRRWMAAYAAATSTVATFETIRAAATAGDEHKPAKSTVGPYRDVLERLFILDPVPAWLPTRSHIAELAKPPKHHLADPALAARLVGATSTSLLGGVETGPIIPRDGPFLGSLFESLVTLSVRVYAEAASARVGHLRTRRGDHEIDLIVERDDGRVIAIEVKLGAEVGAPDVRHLDWLQRTIGDELLDAIVVTTGREAYRRADGIAVVPAALLGP